MAGTLGRFNVPKDSWLTTEDQPSDTLALLIQGNIGVFLSSSEESDEENTGSMKDITSASYRLFNLEKNMFIGAHSPFLASKSGFSLKALNDCTLFGFDGEDYAKAVKLMETQKDTSAYLLSSIALFAEHAWPVMIRLQTEASELMRICDNLRIFFWSLKDDLRFAYTPSSHFTRQGIDYYALMKDKNYHLPATFDSVWMMSNFSEFTGQEYDDATPLHPSRHDYYVRFLKVPLEIKKSFLGYDAVMSAYQCRQAAIFLDEVRLKIKQAFIQIEQSLNEISALNQTSVVSEYMTALAGLDMQKDNVRPLIDTLNWTITRVEKSIALIEKDFDGSTGISGEVLRSRLVETLQGKQLTIAEETQDGTDLTAVPEDWQEQLSNSTRTLLEYAGWDDDRSSLFMHSLDDFRRLADRFSLDQSVREIRTELTNHFYSLYEDVALRSVKEADLPLAVRLMLTFGYVDEHLLQTGQLMALVRFVLTSHESPDCNVFTMHQWLNLIATGQRDPSIGEMGSDYQDLFREKRRRNELSDNDKAAWDANIPAKISFEVRNMFRTNHKMTHGQIMTFCPVLHDKILPATLDRFWLTPQKITASVQKVKKVDYAVFFRETAYRGNLPGSDKEFVMKEVLPDFILMPTFGTRAVMWQEISGRSRTSPARFTMPLLCPEETDGLIVRLLGNFRWELCRTMMGAAWNNIAYKSLTSEYSDYIQFYKKNKDLTEEGKEKIKVQIQRHRNMLRDIFTSDYETYINHEANSVVRLNRVARALLFRYCPFNAEIRQKLANQPMYKDLITVYENNRASTIKRLNSRYAQWEKDNFVIDEDLSENLAFYKDN